MRQRNMSKLIRAATCCVLVLPVNSIPRFRNLIPNGYQLVIRGELISGIGHINHAGEGKLNSFGKDFILMGGKWTEVHCMGTQSCLCHKDSDGDGYSNGQELGDPKCIWTGGKAPSAASYHPGEGSSCLTCHSGIDVEAQIGAHASLMGLSLGFLVPSGIMVPVLCNKRWRRYRVLGFNWFDLHFSLMVLSVIAMSIGLAMMIWFKISQVADLEGDVGKVIFITPHGIVGLVSVLLLYAQVALGIFRPKKTDNPYDDDPDLPRTKNRIIWEYVHANVGRVYCAFAFYMMWTGFENLKYYIIDSSKVFDVLHWVFLGWVIILIMITLYAKVREHFYGEYMTRRQKIKLRQAQSSSSIDSNDILDEDLKR